MHVLFEGIHPVCAACCLLMAWFLLLQNSRLKEFFEGSCQSLEDNPKRILRNKYLGNRKYATGLYVAFGLNVLQADILRVNQGRSPRIWGWAQIVQQY